MMDLNEELQLRRSAISPSAGESSPRSYKQVLGAEGTEGAMGMSGEEVGTKELGEEDGNGDRSMATTMKSELGVKTLVNQTKVF